MIALLAAAALLQVQVRDEPKDWQLIATDHFNIYYPSDELLPRAKDFAGWFERSWTEHVAAMGVQPPRIHVFLYRSYHDLQQSSFLALGTASPLGQRIRAPALRETDAAPGPAPCRLDSKARALALAEPLRNRIFIHCQASDRWNYWFAKHELAHQFQFEHLYAFRLPSWLIALKDPLIPQWWWEGGADYWAGIFDSDKDAWVRDLADERLFDLKELFSGDILNPHDYPSVYYEGSYFWRFLDEEYGAGTGKKLFDRTDRGLPIASQKPVQHVVGKPRVEIERDFEANLRAKWVPLMAGRTVPTDRLTDTRSYYRRHSLGGRWSPDGNHLAWVGDRKVVPELFVDDSGILGFVRSVDGSRVVSIPSWSPDGKRLVVAEQRLNRDRLLLLGAEGGSEAISLDFDELYSPEWSPDGKKIAFAALKNGTSDIYVLTLEDRSVQQITNDPDGDFSPAWSPDGRLAWIKEVGGRTLLYVDGKPVTRSWALLRDPRWAPDGKSIVLAADVGGVWDAFSVDPATGTAKRLTKFRGGVGYPTWHPTDGTLVFTYFEGRGTDLYRVKPEPQDEPAFDQEDRKPWYDQFRKTETPTQPQEKTRVFGVNWLMFPVTSFSLLLPGGEFAAGDRDSENNLAVAGYGTGSRFWTGGATVTNTRWRPTIGAAATASRSSDMLEALGTGFVNLPLLETFEIGAGWSVRERSEYFDPPPNAYIFDSGPSIAARFSNQNGVHPRDPSWGIAIGGTATLFSEDFGGDREMNEYFGFLETSTSVFDQDLILWTRCTFERIVGRSFLPDEFLKISRLVRGARTLEGLEEWSTTLEVRFPIWRDLLWKPLELIGLGEWLILKDLRGFVFGDFCWLAENVASLAHERYDVYSAGIGLRLDLSFMLWPVVNGRVPIRLEGWWAFVGQAHEPNRGVIGGGFSLGF
ncbi:MAG: PD40 domain-containing protein [Planctomycetes bacterium]|nr:PD40 domain-containing protein [Planctomycetota bacterium]